MNEATATSVGTTTMTVTANAMATTALLPTTTTTTTMDPPLPPPPPVVVPPPCTTSTSTTTSTTTTATPACTQQQQQQQQPRRLPPPSGLFQSQQKPSALLPPSTLETALEHMNHHHHNHHSHTTNSSGNMYLSDRTLTWTSINTPATSVGAALRQDVKCHPKLQLPGIPVIKVTSRGVLKPRVLTVSRDVFALFCTHSKLNPRNAKATTTTTITTTTKSRGNANTTTTNNNNNNNEENEEGNRVGFMSTVVAKSLPLPWLTRKGIRALWKGVSTRDYFVRYIDVADMDCIQTGVVGTKSLEDSRTLNRLRGLNSIVDDKRHQIVSILHHSSNTTLLQHYTLDVLIESDTDRELLVSCLKSMMAVYKTAARFASNEALLLRYIWYDVDLNRDAYISALELDKILNRINFKSVVNVRQRYKDYKRQVTRNQNKLLAAANPATNAAAAATNTQPGSNNSSSHSKKSSKKIKQPGLTYPQVMTLLQQFKEENKSVVKTTTTKAKTRTTTMQQQQQQVQEAQQSISNTTIPHAIWNEIFGASTTVVTAPEFHSQFIHGCQKQTAVTLDDVEQTITILNQMELNHSDHIDNDNNDNDNNKEQTKNNNYTTMMSRARFELYLFHEMNSAYDPWKLEPPTHVARLDKPLSYYWISTSHNTYLTGDQLRSHSSVSMYLTALRRGCKCLELDCWDGFEKMAQRNEYFKRKECYPVVYHGHTLTSKILFQDVILAVKCYMEENPNTYPIILSLENHCSLPFQKAMADCMKSILGPLLYVPTTAETQGTAPLPSPESLRGRVVVKGKRPPDPDDVVIFASSSSTTLATTTASQSQQQHQGGTAQNANNQTGGSNDDNEDDDDDDDDDDPYDGGDVSTVLEPLTAATADSPPVKNSSSKPTTASSSSAVAAAVKPPKVVKELSRLTLFHGTSYKDFEKSLQQPGSFMHSIGETKINKILNKKPENTNLWRLYNVQHMTRTYPAGSRIDSSNYNPLLAWSVGCQLVALNFQTPDAPLILNDGLFRQNRQAGYVLKPDSIMGKSSNINNNIHNGSISSSISSSNSGANEERRDELQWPTVSSPVHLRVRVLCGSCLPKPDGDKMGEAIDPFVSVTIHDVKMSPEGRASYVSDTFSTHAIGNNGFCPVWAENNNRDAKGTSKKFLVHSPDVAMIVFALKEDDVTSTDDKVADAAIPISCLRTGYRSVQLYDKNGTRCGPFGFATLLVEIRCYVAVKSGGGGRENQVPMP